MIEAIVFDLDGILIDSEHVWDEVRQQLADERGGRWNENASRDMMGMSSLEWSRYMRDVVGLTEEPEEISAEVVRRLEDRYRRELPLIPGAERAVERLAARWPLALASSSNRELIDLVLESSGLGRYFEASVSSEEVARGKPAPDVFLEAARRLGVESYQAAPPSRTPRTASSPRRPRACGRSRSPTRTTRRTRMRSRPPTSSSRRSRS